MMRSSENKLDFSKGSQWGKWDLQACTNHYTEYNGPTLTTEQLDYLNQKTAIEKVKISSKHDKLTDEEYAKIYIEYLVKFTDLNVIAITNHNTGKGLQAIIDYLKTKKEDPLYNRLHIFPGVEILATDKCHILIIFNLETKNKNKFEWDKEGKVPTKEISWDEYIDLFMNKIGIPAKRFEQSKPAAATHSTSQILNLHKDWDFIPIFPHINGDGGWYKEIPENTRKDIFNHEIFGIVDIKACSGNTDLINILCGQKEDYGSKIKAKVHTSDAKSLTQIGSSFVWIKANPTFEGLKQIIYEPNERVRIQSDMPGQKKPYSVIDRIRFIDNTGNNYFPSDYIELNQDLNAIIGGKSTGKSLLLYYIAKSVDKIESQKRLDKLEKSAIHYSFDEDANFDFEVVWGDGEKQLLSLSRNPEAKPQIVRKIIYIPQNYLNRLSDKDIESRESLNEFILNVLLQEETILQHYNKTIVEVKELENKISIAINELFQNIKAVKQLEVNIKDLGDEKGIQSYIKQIENEIKEIKVKSGLSDIESTSYEELSKKVSELKNQVAELVYDKEMLEKMSLAMISKVDEIDNIKNEYAKTFINKNIIEEVAIEFASIADFKSSIDTKKEKIIKGINDLIKVKNKELVDNDTALKPLLAKIKLKEEIEKKSTSLKLEEGKLNKIKLVKNSLTAKIDSISNKKTEVAQLYEQITSKYKGLQSEFKQYENQLEDISLNIVIQFDEESFNGEVVEEYINKPDLKNILDYDWSTEFFYKYNPDTHSGNMTKIFQGILEGKIKTVKNKFQKDAVSKLFENRFDLNFKISYKNDSLDKMSPGKKALVLLRLLIALRKEEWPILLDQPEDDLDSRSVYLDLVPFLKNKKTQRQIIIVTHNPNLVVGSDSEEVMVSNQDGQEVGRDNNKYRFEYVSGALENSFEEDKALKGVLYQKGIKQHVCEVLEGGQEAFEVREKKYGF